MRFIMVLISLLMTTTATAGNLDLSTLEQGAKVHGFTAAAIYLNDADEPFGGRFIHDNTGFTLEALQIETAPQGFIWVNSYLTSDMGEPHTQEHLLLGKGNVGRAVASLESMTLTGSSAFTLQWRTCYHFNTSAGPEIFYQLFDRQIDALLHPDYTDEEIRREVRNIGVTVDPKTGELGLEEKGTVYNEMVSSADRPFTRLYYNVKDASWGSDHPLSNNAGGAPAAIREMTPEDIRTFHAETHHLAGMGMVGAYPSSMPLDDVLEKTAKILDKLEAKAERPRAILKTEKDLPPPQPAMAGELLVVDYPLANEAQPSPVGLVWPAGRELDPTDTLLLNLFIDNFAGDPTTNLYKLLIDSRSRVIETGARSVFSWVFEDQGQPLTIGLVDVAPDNLTEEGLEAIRKVVIDELDRIVSWEDGSEELAEFQKRMKSRVVETQRSLANFVNSPPRFGVRGTGPGWMQHLYSLAKTGDFKRSVTMKPQLAEINALLDADENIWREKLAEWNIAGFEPVGIAVKPSAALVERDAKEREERLASALAEMKQNYGVDDDQEAIKRYQADYDKTTAELDAIAKQVETPKFLEKPPLGLDDQLQWSVSSLTNGVSLFSATFDTMSSATTGLWLDLDSVPDEDLFLLSVLPTLLTDVGVIVDGKPVPYEEMSERLRNEILSLDASYSTSFRTGRAELFLRGSGNNASESKRAVEWMETVLSSPDWREENLARIRDVVGQSVGGLRNRMQGSEESWVNEPANAYRRQDSKLLLTTANFLTRAHNAHRLAWLLRDAGDDASRAAIVSFLDELTAATKNASREQLSAMLGALSGGDDEVADAFKALVTSLETMPEDARENAEQASKDLDAVLADLPDGSLNKDSAYLVGQMKADLLVAPSDALARLNSLREGLMQTGNARMYVVGSSASREALAAGIQSLSGILEHSDPLPIERAESAHVRERLTGRSPAARDAYFVGLLTPQLKGGVFLHSVKGWSYLDRDKDKLLDFLASRLYAGGGAHGIFMKTWGAGLAYSNGYRGSLSSGIFGYYAERTPELPQTLAFVIDEMRNAEPGEELVEYAVALAFGGSRAASRYESRAEAMANDLVDGLSPDVVAGFRNEILELRKMDNLHREIAGRMLGVYSRVLPGLGETVRDEEAGSFFVIGNDKQLNAWQEYLRTVEGEETVVWRLYPRDFWME
jgi:Zn-dependent M16 (insulinase) family peptidase